ncbi:MAG: hypothetical protein ACLP01_08060 [Solirubrobacteraceae bacterium]
MAQTTNSNNGSPEVEQRLRRLEALAALAFIEQHSVGAGMSAVAVGGVRARRAECARFAAQILAEVSIGKWRALLGSDRPSGPFFALGSMYANASSGKSVNAFEPKSSVAM